MPPPFSLSRLFAQIFDRFRRPNQLFLYSLHRDRRTFGGVVGPSVAAVATIGPGFFQIENTFRFGNWTTVASAANGRTNWLFFHNQDDGSAETGSIDGSFRYVRSQSYPPGSFLDWPYNFVVVNGLGHLLLLGYPKTLEDKASVGFAQVIDDGSFVEWWRTKVDLPPPDFNNCSIVGLPRAHAWFTSDVREGTPAGGTTYVFDVEHAVIKSSRKSDTEWQGMAADGELLYLFNGFDQRSEICVVNDFQQLVPVKAAAHDPDLETHPVRCVASTPGAQLGFTFRDSGASVRVLSAGGFPSTYSFDDLGDYWHWVVRC